MMKTTGTLEAGTGLWLAGNETSTNGGGFSGTPGGSIGTDGIFGGINGSGFWWSSAEIDEDLSSNQNLYYLFVNAYMLIASKRTGISVRCLRD